MWVLAAIYASNKDDERSGLWNILECACNQEIPIMIIGGYNVIALEGEKKGGKFVVNSKVRDF